MQNRVIIQHIEDKITQLLGLTTPCEFEHLYGKSYWIKFSGELSVWALKDYGRMLEEKGLSIMCHHDDDELDGSTRSIEFTDPVEEILVKLNLNTDYRIVPRRSFDPIPAPASSHSYILASLVAHLMEEATRPTEPTKSNDVVVKVNHAQN